jgi:hypothetical protein
MAALGLTAAAQIRASPAVWKPQHVVFTYMGVTSRYTCDGLRDKVRAMLLDLGVRRDLKVFARGCEDVRINLRHAAPIPSLVIDFNTAALHDPAARSASPPEAPMDARFEPFKITADPFRNMGPAECELVDDFARQILPRFATRGVTQSISCVPFQETGGNYWVKGEILKPVGKP